MVTASMLSHHSSSRLLSNHRRTYFISFIVAQNICARKPDLLTVQKLIKLTKKGKKVKKGLII